MGITFKDNCSDIRNTKIVSLIKNLKKFVPVVDIYDPWAKKDEVRKLYNLKLISDIKRNFYDCIVLTVSHDEFKKMSVSDIKAFGKKDHILYDVKYLFNSKDVDGRL